MTPIHDTSSSTASPSSRRVAVTIALDAPVDVVWRALTDASELVNWFPTDAAVDPRPGGSYVISWEGQWQWSMDITDFEPLKRLRMVDRDARPFDTQGRPLEGAAPVEQAIEITLERDEDRTMLRLVHSGFGHGAAWDDEIDGVGLGWNVELRGLRHYLDRHRGRTRRIAWAHATSDRPLDRVWSDLTSPGGFVEGGFSSNLAAGDPCALTLATGDTITGSVVWSHPGRQLVITAENFGAGLLRLSLDRAAGRSMVQVWLSAWTLPDSEVAGFGDRARRVLSRVVSA